MDIIDKVVIITGTSCGMGAATALKLEEDSAKAFAVKLLG